MLMECMVKPNARPVEYRVDARNRSETKGNENMHVVIQHQITDPVKWDQGVKNIMSMIEQHRLPRGLKPLQYLPSVDGRNAVCLWEGESLRAVKEFSERETAGSRNEYFEVKEQAAIGLPKAEELARAA